MYFNQLNEEKKSLFNLNSFNITFNMLQYLNIEKIYFNGGAILNQNKLKKKFEVDDWDIHLIQGEEGTNETINKLKKLAEKEKGYERGSTASTLKSLIFNYLGKKIDFQIKKEYYLPEENCTFDIDSICTILNKNDKNFYIQNPNALDALINGVAKLQAKQSDIYRILRRIIVIIAKYDIKKFIIENNKEIIINKDNSDVISLLLNQEKRDNIKILKKTDKTKSSCLVKFLCFCYRVKDLYEYIIKILNSHLFDKIFPEIDKAMRNNKFLEEIQKESKLNEKERKINSQNDVVDLTMKYNNNNKNLANELFFILKKSEFNQVKLEKLII